MNRLADTKLSAHAQATQETDSITDPEILMEVLEAREELESAASEEEVTSIRENNHSAYPTSMPLLPTPVFRLTPGRVEQTIANLIKAFSEDPPNLVEAKELAIQLKYWQGLEHAAKEWSPSS